MSEIFNFLNQTRTEKRKSALSSRTEIEEPAEVDEYMEETEEPGEVDEYVEETEKPAVVAESLEKTEKPNLKDIVSHDPAIEVPVKSEVAEADTFDLTAASNQVKIALDPLTIIGEQFRLLRTKLRLQQKEKGTKTVLITSSVPEEGKTFTASCLAGVFAQEPGKRVLLIDCDLRKSGSGSNLGINGTSSNIGMSEVLRGNLDFSKSLIKANNFDFFFVPNGPLPQNPTELLSSPIMERVIRSSAENYDWIIVDSPPLITISDTTLLAPLCDMTILVVRAGATPYKLVNDAMNQLGREKIGGILFNRWKQKHLTKYYYKY